MAIIHRYPESDHHPHQRRDSGGIGRRSAGARPNQKPHYDAPREAENDRGECERSEETGKVWRRNLEAETPEKGHHRWRIAWAPYALGGEKRFCGCEFLIEVHSVTRKGAGFV